MGELILGSAHNADDHLVHFYDSDDLLYGTVAEFLGRGLSVGEPAVVIATDAHGRALCQRLESMGVDVERSRDSGDLLVLDAHESLARFTVDGSLEWDLFKAEMGGAIERTRNRRTDARVRAYGEMVDVLWNQGQQNAAIQLEDFWNDLGRLHRFSLLCAYSLGNFYEQGHRSAFDDICRTHTHVLQPPTREAANMDAHLRAISILQQRTTSLEQEIEQRKKLEHALREALSEQRRAEEAVAQKEEALRLQNEQLQHAVRAKDEFLAMLGHELRNPIAPILTAIQLMRLRGNETREVVVIERQVAYLVRLVDDLLDISRITRGKIELRPRRLELSEVIVSAIETASPLLEQRRHRLEVLVPHRDLGIEVDPERMAQVVANLLTNAAKYSHPGSSIRVLGGRKGANVRLSVKDEGIGIAPDMIGKIFDLFVQQEQTLERASGGLGLGLALVKNLVTLHGGTVSVSSPGPGRGSEFVIEIPASSPSIAERPKTPLPARPPPALNGRRVLIVDDNGDAAELLGDALRALGCDVAIAHDGPTALDRARDFRPEIALLDLGLPVMDGYELARHLRALDDSTDLHLIAVTGYGQASDRRRTRAAGFEQHLVKPVDFDSLHYLLLDLY